MRQTKIEVDKLPSKPSECPYATAAHGTHFCSLVDNQKVCTRTVDTPCCFLCLKSEKKG